MSKYLLEIGTEELPANFSHSVIDQIYSYIDYEFDKKLIKYKNVICTSTPRRIILFLDGLVDQADDNVVTRKGPKASAAFLNGVPTNAAIGFANNLGIDIEDIEIRKSDKGEFVYGTKIEKGESTKSSLSSIIPILINACINNKKVFINGDNFDTIDGTCVRDYTHVCDIASAHIKALKYMIKKNKSIHLENFLDFPKKFKNEKIERKWDELIKIRDICNISIEEKRASK